MMPPRNICVKCGKPLTVLRNGILVRFSDGGGGVKADLHGCEICGFQIATGFARDYFPPDESRIERYREAGLLFDYSKSKKG